MAFRCLPVQLYVGLLLFVTAHAVQHCIEIVDAGLMPIIKGHIGMHFFVSVTNKGPEATDVEVKMEQCCEEFPDGQSECSHFHLTNEKSSLSSNTTRNFTLIHPTLYTYNRKGECLLIVRYTISCNRTKESRQHVTFDSSINAENVRTGLLRGFPKSAVESPPCHSYDEDALDDCKMVDCHVKYFGLRSFFNKGTRTCESVPPCLPTKRRALPDVVYDVTTNTCRNLSSCLGTEDLQHLSLADLEAECPSHDSDNTPAFVNCHHGQIYNGTADCRCQPGYVRAEVPRDPGSPRTQVFHSCNLVGSCWHWKRFFELPPRSVLLTSFLLALLLVLICLCIVNDC